MIDFSVTRDWKSHSQQHCVEYPNLDYIKYLYFWHICRNNNCLVDKLANKVTQLDKGVMVLKNDLLTLMKGMCLCLLLEFKIWKGCNIFFKILFSWKKYYLCMNRGYHVAMQSPELEFDIFHLFHTFLMSYPYVFLTHYTMNTLVQSWIIIEHNEK